MNPLKALGELGQSIWLDNMQRRLVTTGELKRLIEEDGLKGLTSNPTIFQKAVEGSSDYDDFFARWKGKGATPGQVFDALSIRDIHDAAAIFRPVWEATGHRDGYCSLEVAPIFANDTERTIAEARRLWKALASPNVMIKIPGTVAGVPAIEQAISEGININVTLLFGQDAYIAVAEAFIRGLEKRVARGEDISQIASVASFFVSRIDSLVEKTIAARKKAGATAEQQALFAEIDGQVAIANAKQAYRRYQQIFSTPRWKALADKGAKSQRVLWASTSTKNPAWPDVYYVEALIGPDTVDTVPPATLAAYRDHGKPKRTLDQGLDAADAVMRKLEQSGISMKAVTDQLVVDGVKSFADSFHELLAAVGAKLGGSAVNGIALHLPADLKSEVDRTLADWDQGKKMEQLWKREASLWTGHDEGKWLGWLDVIDPGTPVPDAVATLAKAAAEEGFRNAVLLGMGGSSLCPEVMALTFGPVKGKPEMLVLDSTDPVQIQDLARRIDPAKTLFFVSSKSGSTLEPNIFFDFFWAKVVEAVGAAKAGRHFVAITDPGSHLEGVARAKGFRAVLPGVPSIGGRYSALSNFGVAPAAVMGVDMEAFLERTLAMVQACAGSVPASKNPGGILGAVLGTLGKGGRNKVTLVTSPGIGDLGAWLEQLLAESTGKQGKGLIPVDRETVGSPDQYGKDRLFAYLRLESAPDAKQDAAVDALVKAGQPVVRIAVRDTLALGQEFFRWEIATAVAGSILGIDPFDQPDVEAAKIATRKLTEAYEKSGALPEQKPFFEEGPILLFADPDNTSALKGKTLAEVMRAHLGRLGVGDYLAILAYVPMNERTEAALQPMRLRVRDARRVATCLGFGPRFQHSTGQAYKGGPNTGVFIQVTCDDPVQLPVPEHKYTFGIVKEAQARGDLQVLADRKRRLVRVHIKGELMSGLKRLGEAIDKAV